MTFLCRAKDLFIILFEKNLERGLLTHGNVLLVLRILVCITLVNIFCSLSNFKRDTLMPDMPIDHQKVIHRSLIDHSQNVIDRSLIVHWKKSDQSIAQSITFRSQHLENFCNSVYFCITVLQSWNWNIMFKYKTKGIAPNYFFDVFVGLSIQQRQHSPFNLKKLVFQNWDPIVEFFLLWKSSQQCWRHVRMQPTMAMHYYIPWVIRKKLVHS